MLYELHFKGLLCRLLGESRDWRVEPRALYGLSCGGLAATLLLRGPIAPGPTSPAAEGEVELGPFFPCTRAESSGGAQPELHPASGQAVAR